MLLVKLLRKKRRFCRILLSGSSRALRRGKNAG